MKRSTMNKILVRTGLFLSVMIIVLVVHIYMVTHPQAPTVNTIAMARIDFKQAISNEDATKITEWLYKQTGVDHVLFSANSKLVVFTYHPFNIKADDITNNLKNDFNLIAERFKPTEKDMQSGCPVAATSFTYKTYQFIKHIF